MLMKARSNNAKQAFTLVELLVVIGLMGMMLIVAIPAFKGMGQGSAMRSAVAQVRSSLSLARQYAITHNTTTRFVVPGPDGTYAAGTTKHCLRSYSVYDMKNEKYLSPWETLPNGIVFDYRLTHPEFAQLYPPGNGNFFANYITTAELPYPTAKTGSTVKRPMAFIQFRNDGRAAFSAGNHVGDRGAVVLTEGSAVWPDSGRLDASNAQQYEVSSDLVDKRVIVVNRRTGRLEVKTL